MRNYTVKTTSNGKTTIAPSERPGSPLMEIYDLIGFYVCRSRIVRDCEFSTMREAVSFFASVFLHDGGKDCTFNGIPVKDFIASL